MSRLKSYGDDLHPKSNNLTVKQLRQQATFVKHTEKASNCDFL